jgi:hypothetical protein
MGDLGLARKVLETEAAAIHALVARIDATFAQAVQMLVDCRGRVILTGMGKSGIISQKIAATLTSIDAGALPAPGRGDSWRHRRIRARCRRGRIAEKPTRSSGC